MGTEEIRGKIKEALDHPEFNQTICRLLIESLKKDMTKLYIAANTQNNKDFHAHYDAAMERIFALSDQLK